MSINILEHGIVINYRNQKNNNYHQIVKTLNTQELKKIIKQYQH